MNTKALAARLRELLFIHGECKSLNPVQRTTAQRLFYDRCYEEFPAILDAVERMTFFIEVMKLGSMFDGEQFCGVFDNLMWRTDSEYAPITFFVNCSDLFWWATADCEQLTPENLPLLKQAVADVKAALGKEFFVEGSAACDLFCCRVRSLRPQRAVMDKMDARLKPLFEACGPALKAALSPGAGGGEADA